MASTNKEILFRDTSQIEIEYADQIETIAESIVTQSANIQKNDRVLVWFDTPGTPLAKVIYQKCETLGAQTRVFHRDYEADVEALKQLTDPSKVYDLFELESLLLDWADNVLIVRNPENPEAMAQVENKVIKKAYENMYGEIHKIRPNDEVDWTLFRWPTQYDADKQGMAYDEYFNVVMEACNQNWQEIHEAQTHLIEVLDAGRKLEIYANEEDPDPQKRTHLSMDISGMTFCNSTIKRNYPGSEVFSAPQRHSVNGQIFAEGQFLYNGYYMRNIFLRIENGEIVEATAEQGQKGLKEIIKTNTDIKGYGSKYFGEVALGTNRGLTQRLLNSLLVEKVSGSFHMAIGNCYSYETYDGKPVNVNNGNTKDYTKVHWDITVLMHRNPDGTGGGRVVVDGKTIQEDGHFLDPKLSILNPKKVA